MSMQTLANVTEYSRLGSRANPRDRETDVDGRAYSTEEELGFQENLSVGNRNNLESCKEINSGLRDGKRDIR
jgi:hypothetical protein